MKGGKEMEALAHTFNKVESAYVKPTVLKTSLYDLIAAIGEEVRPEEDWLVAETVLHLFDSGQAKFRARS